MRIYKGLTLPIALATTLPVIASTPTMSIEEPTTSELEEVVVTASNAPINSNLLPYTVSVLDHKQLESTGKTELLSAISGQVPSLFVTERSIFGFGISNGGSGGVKIRGVGSLGDLPTNAVLMMVDGQPQFAGIFSHHVADMYGVDEVERVEILRGPGSVLYGSNAMGGVINVITRKAKREGFHATITEQYGSYNTWRSNVNATARSGRLSALVSASYDRTDGLQANSEFRQTSAYAKLGYEISSRWDATLDYSFMNYRGEDPIYPKLEDPKSTDIYYQHVIRGAASLAFSNRYERTNGVVRAYYSYGNHFIDDPDHFHSTDDRLGLMAYQSADLWQGAIGTLGFDFNHYRGSIPMSNGIPHEAGTLMTMKDKRITEYSPYVTLQQNLFDEFLTLNAGFRLAASDLFGVHAVPQGGFTLHPGAEWSLKGSLAKGYRNPSFRELYLYKPANPDLKPENLMNYEFTVGKEWGNRFNFSLTGYFCKGSDMIQNVAMHNENTGSFRNKGIEITAGSSPMYNLTLRASYSYLHTTLKNLTGAPRNQYFLGVTYLPISTVTVDVDFRGIGGLWVYDTMPRQNYCLLNLGARWRASNWLEVMLNLNNITDSRYQTIYGYDMPGFNLSGGLRFKI